MYITADRLCSNQSEDSKDNFNAIDFHQTKLPLEVQLNGVHVILLRGRTYKEIATIKVRHPAKDLEHLGLMEVECYLVRVLHPF